MKHWNIVLGLIVFIATSHPVSAQPEQEARRAAARLVDRSYELLGQGQFSAAADSARLALAQYSALYPNDAPEMAIPNKLLGQVLMEQSLYKDAVPFLEKALALTKSAYGDKSLPYALALRAYAKNLNYEGKFEQSIGLLKEVLVILQNEAPGDTVELATILIAIGSHYRYIGDFNQALDYFRQALRSLNAEQGAPSELLAYAFSEQCQTYIALKNYPEALASAEKSKSVMLALGLENHPDFGYICHDIGKVYFAMGQFRQAVEWQQKALELFRRVANKDTPLTATLNLYVGRAQMAAGDLDNAIASFRQDERILTALFGPDYFQLNKCQFELGKACFFRYQRQHQASDLAACRMYFKQAIDKTERTIQIETVDRARRRLLAETVPMVEFAIRAELQLYDQTHQPELLENAWAMSEKMHGYLLFASTQESQAKHFANIPDTLLEKDVQYRNDLTRLHLERNQLLSDKGHALTDTQVLNLDRRIYEIRLAYLALQASFEQNFPAFYRLKYDTHHQALAATQGMLQPGQTLLEYFSGDSSLIVFIIQSQRVKVVQIPLDFPLANWIKSFRNSIAQYHALPSIAQTPEAYAAGLNDYGEYGYRLFEKLIAPCLPDLSEQVLIIPSAELADLPFEALLSAPPKVLGNFNTYPFLMKEYVISYAYSATSLGQLLERRLPAVQPQGALLGFAPFAWEEPDATSTARTRRDSTTGGWAPLPFSGEEIRQAAQSIGARCDLYIGKEATKSSFIAQSPYYRILHLATHGKADNRQGELSYLAFSAEKGGERMTAAELYNLNIQAALVLLSACETGLGEIRRGEGIAGLAHAFTYAGAQSLVASLWHVNDRSTMMLVKMLLHNLKNGMTKNQALTAAKRQFLKENPGRMGHPFFWAGLTAMGDMAPLDR